MKNTSKKLNELYKQYQEQQIMKAQVNILIAQSKLDIQIEKMNIQDTTDSPATPESTEETIEPLQPLYELDND